MFKFNNTHIFTGYLKQLLGSVYLPTCRIYTKEFADYLERNGKEDPRVLESFGTLTDNSSAVRINYLKNNRLYNYFLDSSGIKLNLNQGQTYWKNVSNFFYESDKFTPSLTKTLHSAGGVYDTKTHEYLGDYLRFLRDYHGVNLLSLYNCFNNKICNNMYHSFKINTNSSQEDQLKITFDAQDSKYRIYMVPVKLFSDYTIAVDCMQGIELFCGLYSTKLDTSSKGADLVKKTYKKIDTTLFSQPFLYDKLNVNYWSISSSGINIDDQGVLQLDSNKVTRWDLAKCEQDLRLFIKVPTSCKSSIVILEGDFRHFNDFKYRVQTQENNNEKIWKYEQNHCVLNFDENVYKLSNNKPDEKVGKLDLNRVSFKPIGKLQLLAFNTGESYPFSDRLVEYLSNSAITPLDTIPDNIKRTQEVMKQNRHHFKIRGLWEEKMQRIIYDYLINAGPIDPAIISTNPSSYGELIKNLADHKGTYKHTLVDQRKGYQPRLGHVSKSTLYDTLGYVDKEAEKWYASWKIENNTAKMRNNIQNIDIYDGLYDI
jgi:hypothetical protein